MGTALATEKISGGSQTGIHRLVHRFGHSVVYPAWHSSLITASCYIYYLCRISYWTVTRLDQPISVGQAGDMYRFIYFIIALLPFLLMSQEAWANRVGGASGAQNLLSTACWLYGFAYLIISLRLLMQMAKVSHRSERAAVKHNGAYYFLIAGCILLVIPFLHAYLKDVLHAAKPAPICGVGERCFPPEKLIKETAMSLIARTLMWSVPFFPWLILIYRKSYKDCRAWAKEGLVIALLPPAFFFIFVLMMQFI